MDLEDRFSREGSRCACRDGLSIEVGIVISKEFPCLE